MWPIRIALLFLLALFAQATYLVGRELGRTDLIIGLVLGTLAGLPTALLLLAATRHSDGGAE